MVRVLISNGQEDMLKLRKSLIFRLQSGIMQMFSLHHFLKSAEKQGRAGEGTTKQLVT